jgi:hypothetical protein
MTKRATCGDAGGVTKDGRSCPTKDNLGVTGFCPWHDPDTSRRQAIQEAGGRAAAEKRAGDGIKRADVGKLETIEDAIRWTRVIGLGLIDRNILPSEANALMRVVAQWHRNEDLRLRRDDLRDLQRQFNELRKAKGLSS